SITCWTSLRSSTRPRTITCCSISSNDAAGPAPASSHASPASSLISTARPASALAPGSPAAYPSIRGFPSVLFWLRHQEHTGRKPPQHPPGPAPARPSLQKSRTHVTSSWFGRPSSDQLSICCTLVLYPVYLEPRSCLCRSGR